jgi:toxin YhaV
MSDARPLIVNGWTLFAHPIFLDQFVVLTEQVEALRLRDPLGFTRKNPTKRLAAVARLVFEVIPGDPTRAEYRLGNTLGDEHRHWFRARFFQQYRLFFRYHAQARIIVFAWFNDEDTRRAYESTDDAYRVFRRMLNKGKPPADWDQLLSEARADASRLGRLAADHPRETPPRGLPQEPT